MTIAENLMVQRAVMTLAADALFTAAAHIRSAKFASLLEALREAMLERLRTEPWPFPIAGLMPWMTAFLNAIGGGGFGSVPASGVGGGASPAGDAIPISSGN
jgi:hypothetical protein